MENESLDFIPEKEVENLPLNIDNMLKERDHEANIKNVEKLRFSVEGEVRRVSKPMGTVGDLDNLIAGETVTIYNPSKPIFPGLLAGRKEPLVGEISNIEFFREENGTYIPTKELRSEPFNSAQDPSFTPDIQNYHIFTVNKIETNSEGKIISVREQLFKFKLDENSKGLEEPFAEGPEGMKCIRLTMWPDGQVGIFTRPQGGKAGRGQIGYIEVETLGEVQDAIPQAEILKGVFSKSEWGGVNDVININSNNALTIAHIARFKPGTSQKEYYALGSIFDREKKCFKGTEIIASVDDFPFKIKPKKDDLESVIYPGGAVLKKNGSITLFGGDGDRICFKGDKDIKSILSHCN